MCFTGGALPWKFLSIQIRQRGQSQFYGLQTILLHKLVESSEVYNLPPLHQLLIERKQVILDHAQEGMLSEYHGGKSRDCLAEDFKGHFTVDALFLHDGQFELLAGYERDLGIENKLFESGGGELVWRGRVMPKELLENEKKLAWVHCCQGFIEYGVFFLIDWFSNLMNSGVMRA